MTLVLARGENEELVIGDEIRLKFVDFKQNGGGCYVLVDAPKLQEVKEHNAALRGALKDAWLEISNMQHQLKLKQTKDADGCQGCH